VNTVHPTVILYAITAVYFAGVMVRLMLTLTPCVCVLAGIAFSRTYERYLKDDNACTTNLSGSINAPIAPGGTPTTSTGATLSAQGNRRVNQQQDDGADLSDSNNRNLYDKVSESTFCRGGAEFVVEGNFCLKTYFLLLEIML